jgi:hypothetical protein
LLDRIAETAAILASNIDVPDLAPDSKLNEDLKAYNMLVTQYAPYMCS